MSQCPTTIPSSVVGVATGSWVPSMGEASVFGIGMAGIPGLSNGGALHCNFSIVAAG